MRCIKMNQQKTNFLNLTNYTREELKLKIDLFMYEINMPPHLKGRKYLSWAIEKVYMDGDAIKDVMGGLYREIAEEDGSSVARVERNMRTAINTVWSIGKGEKLEEYLRCPFQSCKPSPREFIAIVADRLRRNLMHSDFLINK